MSRRTIEREKKVRQYLRTHTGASRDEAINATNGSAKPTTRVHSRRHLMAYQR